MRPGIRRVRQRKSKPKERCVMGFQPSRHASQLLDHINEMTSKGWETASIVERAEIELRALVEREFTEKERLDYTRRLAAGEPVMDILKRVAAGR